MKIALDSTALSVLFVPGATSRTRTGSEIQHARERLDFMHSQLSKSGGTIIIPAPSLAEVIVKLTPDETQQLLAKVKVSRWFEVASFDAVAAVELGIRTRDALALGDKRGGIDAPWAKVKFDSQILSIAIAADAEKLISDDVDVIKMGENWGFPVVSIQSLPLPPELEPPPLFADVSESIPPPTSTESEP